MGSYLSAPMLVFRTRVLARACKVPRSDGPAVFRASSPSSPLTFPMSFSLVRQGVIFLPSLSFLFALISTLLITFHVLSAGSLLRPAQTFASWEISGQIKREMSSNRNPRELGPPLGKEDGSRWLIGSDRFRRSRILVRYSFFWDILWHYIVYKSLF